MNCACQTKTDTGSVVERVLQAYPREPASLISVLQDIQEGLQYLPADALERVAVELGTPRANVYYVATFYKAFNLKPRGRHTIRICTGTACHVRGAGRLVDTLHETLAAGDGETTADGAFTVQTVRCLGCCSLAPAVVVDREIVGNVTPDALRKRIKRCRESDAKA